MSRWYQQDPFDLTEENYRDSFSTTYRRERNDIEEDSDEEDSEDEFQDAWTSTDVFRQMVIQLSEYLEVKHVYQLSYFLDIPMSPDKPEGVQFLALMREAETRMIVTCDDFSRLLKGFSSLTPCEVVDKAISTVTFVEDQLDRGERTAENSRRSPEVWHWKKFCEWYENLERKAEWGFITQLPTPYVATTEEIKQYLKSMYPHFRVNTIKKHFQSIQKYKNVSEKDKKEVENFLNRLGKRQTSMLQKIKDKWPTWSKSKQQDDEE